MLNYLLELLEDIHNLDIKNKHQKIFALETTIEILKKERRNYE